MDFFNHKNIFIKNNKDTNLEFIYFELLFKMSKKINSKIDFIIRSNELIDFDNEEFFNKFNFVIKNNYPIQYITNKIYFYGKEYYIQEGVFIPRQETEFIFDWILKNILIENNNAILDICTGSGVLANSFSIYKNPKKIDGIDIDKKAIEVCIINKNKHKTNVNFFCKNIFEIENEKISEYDLIICNPPYISIDDKNLDVSTKFDPPLALFCDRNGLGFYIDFLKKFWQYIKIGTNIVFEIGFNQKQELEKIVKGFYFDFIKDMDGNYRLLHLIKK